MGGSIEAVGKGDVRDTLYAVIFEHTTRAGRNFDVALLIAILGSVTVVILESVTSIREDYGLPLRVIEWSFTGLFCVEYVLRLLCVRHPWRYATSFFGTIDLLAVVPSFVAFVFPGSQALASVRAMRLLRVFRILKLARFVREADTLVSALRASQVKIFVFLGSVLTVVLVLASVMYVVEGEDAGFTSIPRSMYWAIVTMTTVGYGDIAPKTVVGQTIASLMMVLGYSILAVPTGIVSVNLSDAARKGARRTQLRPKSCTGECQDRFEDHARFCKFCGAHLSNQHQPIR